MKLKLKRLRELAAYFAQTMKEQGFAKTLKKTTAFLKARRKKRSGRFLAPAQEIARQRAENFTGVKISVVSAIYNTPPAYLRAFLQSVLGQTYQNFELCLADASDEEHAPAIAAVLAEFAQDKIVYTKLAKNEGISANTNAAVQSAAGTYLAFADHDDILAENALYEMAVRIDETGAGMLYSDEALFEKSPLQPKVGHFKPTFSPDYLRSCNYICHLLVVEKSLFEQVGALRPAFDGAQDHDLILRMMETGTRIEHIAKVLYYWRVHAGSTSSGNAAKPYVESAGVAAVREHLSRTGVSGSVQAGPFGGTYRVQYDTPGDELVSILIPNKDHVEDLQRAISSIYEKTVYENFEVIIIENNSQDEATFAYYETLKETYPRLQVLYYEGPFNYAAINNFGRRAAAGEYILLLNNDVQVITPQWLGDMLGYCRQAGVGIVGAKLLYPDETVQHAGVIVGLGGYAGHSHKYASDGKSGYMFRLAIAGNLSAVTGACMLVRASVYDEVQGLDETFAVAYNDVDFCLRVRQRGYLVVYDPFAKLYHFESKSRGTDDKGPAKERFMAEQAKLRARYGDALVKDPYYNPHLTLDTENFAEAAVLPEARVGQ
ncbi:glycosyltransferase family 2 protein [Ruminococcaceae bacterium OttesenSCG-928-N02]|nr:glycosyltransferase family 2 protein [Ruminococcaceae bacterium OttesenSCG-928-N02]